MSYAFPMQVDWAGDTAAVIDTETGEAIPVYVFVATLPYSGYSYACKRVLEYTPRPSLKNIQAVLASGQDKAIPEQSTAAVSSSRYGFTRGTAYYGRGNK